MYSFSHDYMHVYNMEYRLTHHSVPHTMGFPDHDRFPSQDLVLMVVFSSYPLLQTKQALEPEVVPL